MSRLLKTTQPGVPTPASKSVIPLINTAKGVGILLIVLGHNTLFGDYFPHLSKTLMSFRLPFFFFISGVTLSIYGRDIRQIMLQRADAWLKPCAVVVITLGLIKIARHTGTVENLLVGLSFATGYTVAWTPLWFLPHLWLIYTTASVLLLHCPVLCKSPARKFVLLISCCAAGYMIQKLFDSSYDNDGCVKQLDFSMRLFDCGLPFSADLLLITLSFFLLGHFLALQIKAFRANLVIALAALVTLLLSRYFWPYNLDLNSRLYDHYLVTPFEALCGIYVMLTLCEQLSKVDYLSRIFGYFGRVSLFILIFHAPIQYILLRELPRWITSDAAIAILSYAIAVGVSVGLYYTCRSNRYLSRLMLPIKFSARPRRLESAPAV